MNFNLGLLSKWRGELMGLAAILIILCHMPANGVIMPSVLSHVVKYGGLGCDVFLLLSGIGMSSSLSKNVIRGGNLLHWYKKRYLRLMIPYLLICIPSFLVFAIRNNWNLVTYISKLTTISYWLEGWGLWFVAMLLPLYFITPFLFRILTSKKRWFWLIVLVLSSWIFGSIELGTGVICHIQFVVCRTPSFFIGLAIYDLVRSNLTIPFIYLICVPLLLLAVSILIRYTIEITATLFWIEGIPLTAALCLVLDKCHLNILHKLSSFMGTISLESYCTNVFMLGFFKIIPWQISDIDLNPGNWTFYVFGTVCCILFSYVINRISIIITSNVS